MRHKTYNSLRHQRILFRQHNASWFARTTTSSIDLEHECSGEFSIINFLIAIPVLIIGTKDYLVSAYQRVSST